MPFGNLLLDDVVVVVFAGAGAGAIVVTFRIPLVAFIDRSY